MTVTEADDILADQPVASPERSRFFGRSKGKRLRQEQSRIMAEQLPRLLIVIAGEQIDPAMLFPFSPRAVRLEIGFGGGEHLLKRALENPETGFIGCEPFVNGMAKLVMEIDRLGVRNIRVFDNDATKLLKRIAPASVDEIDLLYPDPWPKRRQRKRRFIAPDSLAQLAACLKPNGLFRFASDIDDYVGWTLSRVLVSPDWIWPAEGPHSWQTPYEGWIRTRYESKAVQEGRTSSYLTFVRR
jgi:tRNA (guanine-N7-)-methyltransferase